MKKLLLLLVLGLIFASCEKEPLEIETPKEQTINNNLLIINKDTVDLHTLRVTKKGNFIFYYPDYSEFGEYKRVNNDTILILGLDGYNGFNQITIRDYFGEGIYPIYSHEEGIEYKKVEVGYVFGINDNNFLKGCFYNGDKKRLIGYINIVELNENSLKAEGFFQFDNQEVKFVYNSYKDSLENKFFNGYSNEDGGFNGY